MWVKLIIKSTMKINPFPTKTSHPNSFPVQIYYNSNLNFIRNCLILHRNSLSDAFLFLLLLIFSYMRLNTSRGKGEEETDACLAINKHYPAWSNWEIFQRKSLLDKEASMAKAPWCLARGGFHTWELKDLDSQLWGNWPAAQVPHSPSSFCILSFSKQYLHPSASSLTHYRLPGEGWIVPQFCHQNTVSHAWLVGSLAQG